MKNEMRKKPKNYEYWSMPRYNKKRVQGYIRPEAEYNPADKMLLSHSRVCHM